MQGIVVGIANIIPGVSGGTMMVAMGIYDKLIHSITHLYIRGIPFVLAHQSHNDHNAKEQKKRKHHPPCDPLPPYMGEDKRKASHDQRP